MMDDETMIDQQFQCSATINHPIQQTNGHQNVLKNEMISNDNLTNSNSFSHQQQRLTSSMLLAKMENINWLYSLPTMLNGVKTDLLFKYIVLANSSYALMVTDFVSTYFECLIGEQIDQHYIKYNKNKLSHDIILAHVRSLLQDLPNSVQSIEKIQVECHTYRITIRCTKIFPTGPSGQKNVRFNWAFHIISTDAEVFAKHFSAPLFRGLVHYYNISKQNQQQLTVTNNDSNNSMIMKNENNIQQQDGHHEHFTNIRVLSLNNDNSTSPYHLLDKKTLDDIFRYD